MALESVRTILDVYNNSRNSDSFRNFVDPTETKKDCDLDLACYVANEFKMARITTALFLSGAPKALNTQERIGTALFVSFVTLVDSELDKKDLPQFSDPKELNNYLLNTSQQIGEYEITLGEFYSKLISHFPPQKRAKIADFCREMLTVQVQNGNHKEAGEYGFKEIQEYKNHTNRAYSETAIFLANNHSETMANFSDSTFAIQLLDDAWDWQQDSTNDVENLLIGMARDVWIKKGMPAGEDFDYLVSHLNTKISIRILLNSPFMKDTKSAYQAAFDEEIRKSQDFIFRNGITFEWNYVLGMKNTTLLK